MRWPSKRIRVGVRKLSCSIVVFESENPPFFKVGDDIWFAKGGVESCKFAKGGLFSDPSSSPLTKVGSKTDEAINGLRVLLSES